MSIITSDAFLPIPDYELKWEETLFHTYQTRLDEWPEYGIWTQIWTNAGENDPNGLMWTWSVISYVNGYLVRTDHEGNIPYVNALLEHVNYIEKNYFEDYFYMAEYNYFRNRIVPFVWEDPYLQYLVKRENEDPSIRYALTQIRSALAATVNISKVEKSLIGSPSYIVYEVRVSMF